MKRQIAFATALAASMAVGVGAQTQTTAAGHDDVRRKRRADGHRYRVRHLTGELGWCGVDRDAVVRPLEPHYG